MAVCWREAAAQGVHVHSGLGNNIITAHCCFCDQAVTWSHMYWHDGATAKPPGRPDRPCCCKPRHHHIWKFIFSLVVSIPALHEECLSSILRQGENFFLVLVLKLSLCFLCDFLAECKLWTVKEVEIVQFDTSASWHMTLGRNIIQIFSLGKLF